MSIAATIIVVTVIIGLYYVGMIGYDLYAEKMKKEQSDDIVEEAIDVSGQLMDFDTLDISGSGNEESGKKKAFLSWMCQGLSPQKISNLLEDAVTGTPNAELKNLLYRCQALEQEPSL